jgi:hypothetical protein
MQCSLVDISEVLKKPAYFCSDGAVGYFETLASLSYQTTCHGLKECDLKCSCCEDLKFNDVLLSVVWMFVVQRRLRFSQLCI